MDEWPRDNVGQELASDSIDMFQDLLAAPDRYPLDRMKLMCSRKLWDNVTVDNVAAILVCAETYSCPELKKNCMDFCTVEENFKQVASNDIYALLELRFPPIAAEIREKARTSKLK
ncbi:hypothetical protein VPH35_101463 [Triticum aestivum]|uniref:BPM/SPOP BACK domain-containing protein n=1 Tax=Aegilops tauschii TaxID=37682 RepID=N1R441_AEGTA